MNAPFAAAKFLLFFGGRERKIRKILEQNWIGRKISGCVLIIRFFLFEFTKFCNKKAQNSYFNENYDEITRK